MVAIIGSGKTKKRDSENETRNAKLPPKIPNKKIKLADPTPPPPPDVSDEEGSEPQLEEDDDEECDDDAEPIGDVVRVSKEGGKEKKHYTGFSYNDRQFHLDDPVLVAPEEGAPKPSVAIIKDICRTEGGKMNIFGQLFYRPEEAKKKGGGKWQSRHDARELFLSFQLDEIRAYTVMHKCVIHLVPVGKPIPDRKQNPGFIVQKVYDYVSQKLRNLTERDCTNVARPQAESEEA